MESDDWESFLHFICRNFNKFQKFPHYYCLIIKDIILQDKVQVRLDTYHLEVDTLKHNMSREAFKILKLLALGITRLKIKYNGKAFPLRFPRLQELHYHSSLGLLLNDEHLENLPRLTHLKKLCLYNFSRELKGISFKTFNRLSSLYLISNDLYEPTTISEELVLNLKKLKYLTHLHLVNLKCEDQETWLHMSEIHELRELVLNCTSITDDVLYHLSKHPNLSAMRLLDNCNITEKGLLALKMMRNLKAIDFSYNPHISVEILESWPAAFSDYFEGDILSLIWTAIPPNERKEFLRLCKENHELKLPAYFNDVRDKRLLDIALWIVCQSNLHRSLKQLLKLSRGKLALSQKHLNILLKTAMEAGYGVRIIHLLMDAGARIL